MFPIGVVSGLTRFSMVLHGFVTACDWALFHVVARGRLWLRMVSHDSNVLHDCVWLSVVLQGFAGFRMVWCGLA